MHHRTRCRGTRSNTSRSLPPSTGTSLFALEANAADLSSWEAVKGKKICTQAGFYLNAALKDTYGAGEQAPFNVQWMERLGGREGSMHSP